MINYKNLQRVFQDINNTKLSADDLAKIEGLYDNKNHTYSYFDQADADSKKKFVLYFRFFKTISQNEDNTVLDAEVAERAYIATVLFGAVKTGKECETLQRYLNENYKDATKPIHDVFAAITIQPKSQYLDLPFWRELIQGAQTKKAIILFANAADIANKFGLSAPTSKSYALVLTKIFPKNNAQVGKLYLYAHREKTQFGYAYLNECNALNVGAIEKTVLSDITVTILEQKFADPAWQSGELLNHQLILAIQENIFSAVNAAVVLAFTTTNAKETTKTAAATSPATPPLPISRKLTMPDIEVLQGKLTYSRFSEQPELAGLCRQYKTPEFLFERCLDLLPANKKKDNLPDITIIGADDCKDYILTKLPHDDFRAFLLGQITNCCQSIGGNSEGCVIDGWCKEDNGFYVLLERKKGRDSNAPVKIKTGINYSDYSIVGQAYVWRSCNGNVVFDSWENLRPLSDDPIAVKMLSHFSQHAISDQQYAIFRVTIGIGGRTPQVFSSKPLAVQPETMLQGWQYGDSKFQVEINSIEHDRVLKQRWLRDLDSAITKIQGITLEQKEKLKTIAPLSVHYCQVLNHAENTTSTFNHFLKFALANEKFLPDMIQGMIALYIRYDSKIADETLNILMKSGLSMQRMLTSEEAKTVKIVPVDVADTDSEDDEENRPAEGLDAREHAAEAQVAADEEDSSDDEPEAQVAADEEDPWDDEPENISIEMPKDFVGLSLEIASFVAMCDAYSVQPDKRNVVLQGFMTIYKMLSENSTQHTSHDQYEIFKLLLMADVSNELVKSQIMQQFVKKLSALRVWEIAAIAASVIKNGNILSPVAQAIIREKLCGMIKNMHDLHGILMSASPEQCMFVCTAIESRLPEIIKDVEDFCTLGEYLSLEKCTVVFESMEKRLSELIRNKADFDTLLHLVALKSAHFSPGYSALVYSALKKRVPEFIQNAHDFRKLHEYINSSFEMYNTVRKYFPEMIKNVTDFHTILQCLSPERRIDLCESMRNHFPKMITNVSDVGAMFLHLSPAENTILFNAIQTHLPEIIKDVEYFDIIMLCCHSSQQQRTIVFDVMRPRLPKMINNIRDIITICSFLSSEQRTIVFDVMQPRLSEMIITAVDFDIIFPCFSSEQCTIVFNAIQKRLPEMIENALDFQMIFQHLSSEQRTIVFDVMQPRLPGMIENVADFQLIFSCLASEKYNLCLMCDDPDEMQPNDLYVCIEDGQLYYSCITPSKEAIWKQRLNDEMQKTDQPYLLTEELTSRNLSQLLNREEILKITSSRRHTHPEPCTIMVDVMQPRLPGIIKNIRDFITICSHLSPEQCAATCKLIGNNILEIIKNTQEFRNIAHLSLQQCIAVFDAIKMHLPALIKHARDFVSILSILSLEQCADMCRIAQVQLSGILDSVDDCAVMLAHSHDLHEPKCILIQNVITKKLPTVISNADEFRAALEYLMPEQRIIVYDIMKDKLVNMIYNTSDWDAISCHLPEEQQIEFNKMCDQRAVTLFFKEFNKESSEFWKNKPIETITPRNIIDHAQQGNEIGLFQYSCAATKQHLIKLGFDFNLFVSDLDQEYATAYLLSIFQAYETKQTQNLRQGSK